MYSKVSSNDVRYSRLLLLRARNSACRGGPGRGRPHYMLQEWFRVPRGGHGQVLGGYHEYSVRERRKVDEILHSRWLGKLLLRWVGYMMRSPQCMETGAHSDVLLCARLCSTHLAAFPQTCVFLCAEKNYYTR